MKIKLFTTGRIYVYALLLAAIDTLTISKSETELFNFEVFSFRALGLFTYWLLVKNLADLAERRGYSYKIAMIIAIVGLPTIAGTFSLLIM